MVRAGAIGEVRQIQLTYVQGHNATLVEGERGARTGASTRVLAGPSLVLGDIGTHAHHLGAFVSGQELTEVMAEVWATVPGRTADDTANVLMRWSGGAQGTMWVTNAAAGGVHGLCLPHPRRHRRPRMAPGAAQRAAAPAAGRHRGDASPAACTASLSPAGERAARIEVGHPEGYQEAFAISTRTRPR